MACVLLFCWDFDSSAQESQSAEGIKGSSVFGHHTIIEYFGFVTTRYLICIGGCIVVTALYYS